MSRELPTHPSLEQLKKQARELQRAFCAGDHDALALACAHLPRLGGVSPEQARQGLLSLQEAQHVLAADYGFIGWSWLKAIVEVDFGLLGRLTDREIQTALREVEYQDVVAALAGASDSVRTALMYNMSARVQRFIEEELEFLPPDAAAQAPQVQRRILQVLHRLAQQGQVDWPHGRPHARDGSAAPAPSDHLKETIVHVRRALHGLSLEEVAEVWRRLASEAASNGILSLAPIAERASEPLVVEGLQLAVDGTEPAVIEEILRTRMECVLLPRLATLVDMVVQAALSVQARDSPIILLRKLCVRFCALGEEAGAAEQLDPRVTADELARRLRAQPFAGLTDTARAVLLAQAGCLARAAGLASLAALVGATDDELLRAALAMLAQEPDARALREALTCRGRQRIGQARARWLMCVAGVRLVQLGQGPDEVASGVLQAGREALQQQS